MNRIVIALAAAAAFVLAGQAQAACKAGTPPASLPDGKTASDADMAAANGEVKRYMAETQDYMSCLELTKPSGWEETYNQAIDKMKSVASKFNEQVKAYKSK